MKAAFVKVPLQIEIRDCDDPAESLAPNDVCVEVLYCGLNSKDVHAGLDLATDKPMPLGHEAVGTIVRVGDAVTEFRVGQNVVVETHTFRPTDERLRDGRPELAERLMAFSSRQSFVGEYITVHYLALHAIRDISPKAACLVYPTALALDLMNAVGIELNHKVAVFGSDPVGLICAKLAKLQGASPVILIGKSHSEACLKAAEKMGADHIVLTDKEHPVSRVMEYTGKLGVDRVIVTAPPEVLPQAFSMMRSGGIVAYNGVRYGDGGEWPVTFDANAFLFRKLQLKGVYSVPNLRFPTALELIERHQIDPELMLTHEFSLDQTADALTMLADNKKDVIKVVIRVKS